ncbi:MAG: hypothetical protein JSU69_04950, partial [Candidatus Zixiibacteriota bacterium]
ERYLQENCEFLGIEIPEETIIKFDTVLIGDSMIVQPVDTIYVFDTIHFYIHNNSRDGKRLTGRDLPFHTQRQIHWDRVPPFGLALARFLIDKMQIRRTDYDFLYDGLATLRDYSGENYHHKTMARVELKRFIPLDSLIDNESYARQHERHRVEEAASLVAYITYNFGINRFKMLWQSAASFERSVKELFNMDLAAFEDNWLAFAQLHYEGIREKTVITDTLTLEPKK